MVFIEVNDDPNVRVGSKAVTSSNQLLPQLLEIIDLPIANDSYDSIFVTNRLVASLKVNYAEAANAKSNARCDLKTVAIGSTMTHNVRHRTQGSPINRPLRM